MTDEWEAKLADPHSQVVLIFYSLQTLIIHKHIAFSSTPSVLCCYSSLAPSSVALPSTLPRSCTFIVNWSFFLVLISKLAHKRMRELCGATAGNNRWDLNIRRLLLIFAYFLIS